MKKSNLKKNTQGNKKSVKFNLRKNGTRKYNKKEKLLKKRKRQKKTNKKYGKKQNQKNNKRNLRKTMKGGAIPFSEISEVYDNIKHSVNDAIDVFKDTPASVPNNPVSPNVNPSVDKQFLRSEAVGLKYDTPNIKSIYSGAYSA